MHPQRIGLGVALALHALALAALLSYEPARKALAAAAPIMVELIVPRVEPPKPLPPVRLPKPRPVPRPVQRTAEPPPVLTVPAEAPTPAVVAPQPPPAPPTPIAPPGPAAPPAEPVMTQPIFDADYLDNPRPAYPAQSLRNGEQGRVVLRVLVNPRGTADAVQVFASSGHPRLDDAARDAVLRWKFVPARRGNEAVAAWVRIPIPFTLRK